MSHRGKYSIFDKEKIVAFALILIIAGAIGFVIGRSIGEEEKPVTFWIMCKPGSQVNARRTPDEKAEIVGFLETCDEFRTDGEIRNGYVHALGIGEYGEAWIYCGFVATEKPEAVFENYVCVARTRVACRRWISGPQIEGRGWLRNGSCVQVFYKTSEWAVTNRGYIMSEWLEVDPL